MDDGWAGDGQGQEALQLGAICCGPSHEVLVLSLGIRRMMPGLAMVRAKKHCNLVPYVVCPVMIRSTMC